jgi:hypothetical protein
MRDDGYDIDYYDVNPNFGTLDDFRAFSRRGARTRLRVITELGSITPRIKTRGSRNRDGRPGSRERETCLERYAGETRGSTHHLQDFETFELVGTRSRRRITGTAFIRTSPI